MNRVRVFVCLLLTAVFLTVLLPSEGLAAPDLPPEGWTGIYQRSDLEAVSLLPDGQYVLMNDIDLTGTPWTGLCSEDLPFSGTLDGNGFVIYGMETSATGFAGGLFSYVAGGTLTDLTVAGKAEGPCAGLLIGKLSSGTVSGCRGQGTVNSSFCGGGLIGQISGDGVTVSDCVTKVALTLEYAAYVVPDPVLPENPTPGEPEDPVPGENGEPLPGEPETVSVDETPSVTEEDSPAGTSEGEGFLGGLVGSVYGSEIRISACETGGSLSFRGERGAVGGIVGALDGAATVSGCGTESTLSLSASVYAAAGGTAGRTGSRDVSLSSCFFRSEWKVSDGGAVDLGGTVGSIYALCDVTVDNCVSYGTLSSFASSSSVGGIVGSSVAAQGSVTLSRCSSFLSLSGGGAPLYMGGICGVNRGDGGVALVTQCHADGSLTHTEAPVRDPSLAFGGICGLNGGDGVSGLSFCFSSCDLRITYPLADGAVVGLNAPGADGAEASVRNCYYRAGVTEYFATPVSGAALSDPSSYEGFDFERVWRMDSSTGMPRLRDGTDEVPVLPLGDVDGNGRITGYDARLLAQYLVGRATLSDGQLQRADLNADGRLDAGDVALILRHVS